MKEGGDGAGRGAGGRRGILVCSAPHPSMKACIEQVHHHCLHAGDCISPAVLVNARTSFVFSQPRVVRTFANCTETVLFLDRMQTE